MCLFPRMLGLLPISVPLSSVQRFPSICYTHILMAQSKRKPRKVSGDDTLLSGPLLRQAVNAILRRVRLDRRHDVPYLAGYSRNGKIIYIDKDVPRSFTTRGKRVTVDRFLILHEAVEKA